jgi:hypothetical protein
MEGLSRKERRRLQREARKEAQESRERRERNRYFGRRLAYAGVIILVLAGAGFGLSSYTGYVSKLPGPHDQLAECLTEKGAVMYGAYWCSNCERQKLDFGSSFQYINYVECAEGDPEGKAQPQVCEEKGITGYPTWIADGQKLVGRQPLNKLAELTGCQVE